MSRRMKHQIFTMPEQDNEMRSAGEPGITSQLLDRAGQTAGRIAGDLGNRAEQTLLHLGTEVVDRVGRRLETFQNPLHIPDAYTPPVQQEPGPKAYEVLSNGTLWVNDPALAKQLVEELNLAGIETPGGAFHLGMSLDGQSGVTVKGLESQDPHEIEPLDPQVIGAIMPTRTGHSGRR